MSVVDLILIGLALMFALSGFRQGLIASAASFFGFFGGAVLGAQLSGPVADRVDGSSVTRVFTALVVVLAGALLGQVLAGAIGRAVRKRVTWEPARMVDAVAGAVLSAAAVLLVAWMVATPLATSPFPPVASQVRQSSLVAAVDRAVALDVIGSGGERTVEKQYTSARTLIERGEGFDALREMVEQNTKAIKLLKGSDTAAMFDEQVRPLLGEVQQTE